MRGAVFLALFGKEGGRRSLTGVWPAVLRQHKDNRQNGVAKPQSPYGRQLLSKGAISALSVTLRGISLSALRGIPKGALDALVIINFNQKSLLKYMKKTACVEILSM